jgi:hypothetical protein
MFNNDCITVFGWYEEGQEVMSNSVAPIAEPTDDKLDPPNN